MRENICKGINGQRLMFKYTNSSCSSISKKTNKPIQKLAEDLNRHFSKEDTDCQQTHEKMLGITNH